MENIRRAPPPTPLTTRASVDTVELFLRRPPMGLRRRIERVVGRRVQIEDCTDRTGHWQGVRVIVNRPTLASLAVLEGINRAERGSVICRVDIAIDFEMNTEGEADALAEWIDHHVVLKWRSSKTRKMDYRTTMYWCDARRGRNLVRYQKRQRRHVVRLEMQFYRAASVRRAGLGDLTELPSTSPRKLFDHHIKARRFTDKFKIKAMREAAVQERKRAAKKIERQRNKRTQQFLDRYRASVPRRALYVLEQIDAQNMGGGRGTENVSLDFLKVPDHMTWPALKLQGNSREGAMVSGYYGK